MSGDGLSAAQLLAFAGMGVRAGIVTCPNDGLLVLTVPDRLAPEHVPFLRHMVASLADRLGIERRQVVVLEAGATLEALTAEQLAGLGLRRDG